MTPFQFTQHCHCNNWGLYCEIQQFGDDYERHNWTGLLVEPDPENFEKLVGNHRRATLLPHCFSTKATPEVVEYNARGTNG